MYVGDCGVYVCMWVTVVCMSVCLYVGDCGVYVCMWVTVVFMSVCG